MHKKEDGKMSEVSEYAELAYEILLATISSSSFHSHSTDTQICNKCRYKEEILCFFFSVSHAASSFCSIFIS